MISFLQIWWHWLGVALIPGGFNLLVAYGHLSRDCSYLPFLRPWKTLGVWWWALVQVMLPGVLFWLLYSLSAKPTVNPDLITKAITFGLVFTALVNAYVDTGFFGLDVKLFYTVLTDLAYKQIANTETLKTSIFWREFQKDLMQSKANLVKDCLAELESYCKTDISLKDDQKRDYQDQIQRSRSLKKREEQVNAIQDLLKRLVRRKDLPGMLTRLGCSNSFIKQHFPKSP